MDMTPLVTGPGALLAELFGPARVPGDDEVRHEFVVTLGILFWLVLLPVGGVLWRAVRRRSTRADGLAGPRIAGARQLEADGIAVWRRITRDWTWPQVWGVTWRAEAVHLFLYAGVPLLLETARVVAFVAFLPLTIMGVGEKRGLYEGTFDHLARTICWTFASDCPSPAAEFRKRTATENAQCQRAGNCPGGPVLVRDDVRWPWKLAWAAIALPWIVLWRMGQRQRRKHAAADAAETAMRSP
ncbi:MAG: hypothetical protein ABI593_11005 [Betaproteobacteria bacterium]